MFRAYIPILLDQSPQTGRPRSKFLRARYRGKTQLTQRFGAEGRTLLRGLRKLPIQLGQPDVGCLEDPKHTARLIDSHAPEIRVLWLAAESSEAQSFTLDQMRELAALSKSTIPEERLSRSLERLAVTGVVKERAPEVYDFSVPDYPLILSQLGETAHLEELEDELEEYLQRELDDSNF